MLIGIDGNEANVREKVGVGQYAFELLWQFYESQKFPRSGISLRETNFKFQIYLKNNPRKEMPKERNGWRYEVFGPRALWTQFALPLNLYLSRPRPDIFFSPTHYAPRFSPVPTVVSIMDISYIQYPALFKKSDLYQLRNWTAYSIRNAKKVFTISRGSKDDIIRVYRLPEEKVVVTYPGIKLKAQNAKLKATVQNLELLKEKYGIDGNYILFVGTLQPRKNIIRLMQAFAKVKSQMSNVKSKELELVIVGKKGWLYEDILKAPKKFGVEDKVKFLDFVSDEDLVSLYKNAICFVLPSLYEGFGLPILEAMKYGCPVITSSVSSLPEAGGDAALYVDPENVSDISSKIKMLVKDEKLRQEMIGKGYKQIKKFSWEKTAKETLKALEEVASS